jgi:hypothetical protein
MPFWSHIDVHLSPYFDVNKKQNLNLIIKYDIIEFFLYSIINIDSNVPCWFASTAGTTNDYSKNKI